MLNLSGQAQVIKIEEKIALLQKTFECPICLELMKNAVSTKCDHKFCRHCMLEALGHTASVPCPLCKEPVTKRSLQKLSRWNQIMDKVRELTLAFQVDTGVEFSPPASCHVPLSQPTPQKPPSPVCSLASATGILGRKRKSSELHSHVPIYVEEEAETESRPQLRSHMNQSSPFGPKQMSKKRCKRTTADKSQADDDKNCWGSTRSKKTTEKDISQDDMPPTVISDGAHQVDNDHDVVERRPSKPVPDQAIASVNPDDLDAAEGHTKPGHDDQEPAAKRSDSAEVTAEVVLFDDPLPQKKSSQSRQGRGHGKRTAGRVRGRGKKRRGMMRKPQAETADTEMLDAQNVCKAEIGTVSQAKAEIGTVSQAKAAVSEETPRTKVNTWLLKQPQSVSPLEMPSTPASLLPCSSATVLNGEKEEIIPQEGRVSTEEDMENPIPHQSVEKSTKLENDHVEALRDCKGAQETDLEVGTAQKKTARENSTEARRDSRIFKSRRPCRSPYQPPEPVSSNPDDPYAFKISQRTPAKGQNNRSKQGTKTRSKKKPLNIAVFDSPKEKSKKTEEEEEEYFSLVSQEDPSNVSRSRRASSKKNTAHKSVEEDASTQSALEAMIDKISEAETFDLMMSQQFRDIEAQEKAKRGQEEPAAGDSKQDHKGKAKNKLHEKKRNNIEKRSLCEINAGVAAVKPNTGNHGDQRGEVAMETVNVGEDVREDGKQSSKNPASHVFAKTFAERKRKSGGEKILIPKGGEGKVGDVPEKDVKQEWRSTRGMRKDLLPKEKKLKLKKAGIEKACRPETAAKAAHRGSNTPSLIPESVLSDHSPFLPSQPSRPPRKTFRISASPPEQPKVIRPQIESVDIESVIQETAQLIQMANDEINSENVGEVNEDGQNEGVVNEIDALTEVVAVAPEISVKESALLVDLPYKHPVTCGARSSRSRSGRRKSRLAQAKDQIEIRPDSQAKSPHSDIQEQVSLVTLDEVQQIVEEGGKLIISSQGNSVTLSQIQEKKQMCSTDCIHTDMDKPDDGSPVQAESLTECGCQARDSCHTDTTEERQTSHKKQMSEDLFDRSQSCKEKISVIFEPDNSDLSKKIATEYNSHNSECHADHRVSKSTEDQNPQVNTAVGGSGLGEDSDDNTLPDLASGETIDVSCLHDNTDNDENGLVPPTPRKASQSAKDLEASSFKMPGKVSNSQTVTRAYKVCSQTDTLPNSQTETQESESLLAPGPAHTTGAQQGREERNMERTQHLMTSYCGAFTGERNIERKSQLNAANICGDDAAESLDITTISSSNCQSDSDTDQQQAQLQQAMVDIRSEIAHLEAQLAGDIEHTADIELIQCQLERLNETMARSYSRLEQAETQQPETQPETAGTESSVESEDMSSDVDLFGESPAVVTEATSTVENLEELMLEGEEECERAVEEGGPPQTRPFTPQPSSSAPTLSPSPPPPISPSRLLSPCDVILPPELARAASIVERVEFQDLGVSSGGSERKRRSGAEGEVKVKILRSLIREQNTENLEQRSKGDEKAAEVHNQSANLEASCCKQASNGNPVKVLTPKVANHSCTAVENRGLEQEMYSTRVLQDSDDDDDDEDHENVESGFPSRPLWSFVTSGISKVFHKSYVDQLAQKLNCKFTSNYSPLTTHVLVRPAAEEGSLKCQRTLKYFQGIAGAKWVLSVQWAVDCIKSNRLIPEAAYEIEGDTVEADVHHGPHRARTSPHPLLLHNYDICCLGSYHDLSTSQLQCLVESLGGSSYLVPDMFSFRSDRHRVIVVEADPRDSDDTRFKKLSKRYKAPVVIKEWLLDSIGTYQIKPMDVYSLT